jgi:RHS repeat-associated protein
VQSVSRAVGSAVAQVYASYTYTANGQLATIKDANNNLTTYVYDGHDRKIKTLLPSKTAPNTSSTTDVEQYAYDNGGNLTALTKRDGQTITASYDNLNRMLGRSFPASANNISFGYDLLSRQTSARYADGSYDVSMAYDNAGRLTSSSAGGKLLSHLYDAAGNRVRTTWPEATPFYVSYEYDALNRPNAIKEMGSVSLATYSYDDRSRRSLVTLGNGSSVSYGYSTLGYPASLALNLAGTAQDNSWAYNRNQAQEITQQTWSNDLYQWKGYTNGSRNYTANGLNELVAAAGATISNDANGNLNGDGVWTYGYDADNRLRTASKSGLAASLNYDALGRLRQTVFGATTSNLLYSGSELVAEYDAAGNLQRRYVHGPGVDEPLVAYEGAGTAAKAWLYADHQGSVVATADAAGNASASYSYGPFGEPDTPAGVRFRYTGQQWLADLGLSYYKARFYSPALGRFLQPDSVGYADDMHLYGYVGNSPLNYTDSTGNCPSCVGAASSVVIGGAIRYFTSGGNWSKVFDVKAIATDAALGAIGTGLVSKATNLVSIARAGATNLERNVAKGALGETMSGISPVGKEAIRVGGVKVVPDRLTSTALEEVKNVAAISAKDARQIAREATYAADKELSMTLSVRQGADLSRVQSLIDANAFAVKTIPGVGANGFRILTTAEAAAAGAAIGTALNAGSGK